MSYILDALKKSEQQRRRGMAPTLREAPMQSASTTGAYSWLYVLVAAILLVGGGVIGALRPWQEEVVQPATSSPMEKDFVGHAGVSSAVIATEMALEPVKSELLASQVPKGVVPLGETVDKTNNTMLNSSAAIVSPHTDRYFSAKSADMQYSDLPAAIKQELPPLTIQMHAYSEVPDDRLVSVNSHLVHEGGEIQAGLVVERITSGGMILKYKGYKFQLNMP